MAAEERQAPTQDGHGSGEHRRPRGQGGTHPGRISCVWNVETPTESGHDGVSGKPTARNAEPSGGNRMTREANAGSRKAAGNRNRMVGYSAGRCG